MIALTPDVEPLAALDAAIDDVMRDPLDAATDVALGEDLVHIRMQIDRLEAEFSRRLFRFDRSRGYAATGALSSVAWLRNECHLSGGAAVDRVQVACTLPELPQTESALRNAEIGFQHAAVIARCATDIGTDAVRGAEHTLVDAARVLDPARLNVVARYLRHCIDPDGALQADNQNYARRSLHISQTFDGVFFLDGRLDAEGGELVRTVLGALSGPRSPGDERRPDQRHADALVELASRQLQAGDLPGGHGQRPHITSVRNSGDAARRRGQSTWRAHRRRPGLDLDGPAARL